MAKIQKSKNDDSIISKKNRVDSTALKGVMPGLSVAYSGCCYPVPGDRILGVVHAGKTVSIHRSKCNNIKKVIGTENVITLLWNNDDKIKSKFVSRIKCIISNKNGAIANIVNIINQCSINIDNIKIISK